MGFAPDVAHALPNYGEAFGMIKIDDAAILKRAKLLCQNDGVAWDWVSATPRARVLSNRDRRECLMRARDELIGQAIEAGALQDVTPVHGNKPLDTETGEHAEGSESTPAIGAAFWPRRRVA